MKVVLNFSLKAGDRARKIKHPINFVLLRLFFYTMKVLVPIAIVFLTFGLANAQNNPLYKSEAYSIYPNYVVQGQDTAFTPLNNEIRSTFEKRYWKQQKTLTQYPTLQSDIAICNTLYNLAVEELDNLIEVDSTWRTGKWWGGVWTRDVNYSALLAAAYMNPDVTRVSLMKKVWHDKIIQDTGTGGSWPISTDRIVWTIGAWQLYLVTGDRAWLNTAYNIVKNSLLQDEATVYDAHTGLVRGESSFLDWREEEYPRWMQPADIAMSECLGTNALFYQANVIAARMAQLCGDDAYYQHFQQQAVNIKNGINRHLWIEEKGYYGQYLYGRTNLILSPRSETLGEALCIIFGIADSMRAQRIVSSVALSSLGTPCLSPQIPNIYPYHNNAVWPFVQAYWMWASAIVGNTAAVEHSISAIYRAAALFATNQENFVAENGDYHTAMNSPNMLWSIAGNISIAHRLFAGINFTEEGIVFRPFVPKAYASNKTISNFKYRKSLLSINVEGFGDGIQAFYLDGKLQKQPLVHNTLKGKHTIRIVLNGQFRTAAAATFKPIITSPETPAIYLDGTQRLAWRQVPDAKAYKILRNGQLFATQEEKVINGNRLNIPVTEKYTEYQIIAVGLNGTESFASEPLPCYDLDDEQHYHLANYAPATTFSECKGYSSTLGAVEIDSKLNTRIAITVTAPQDGDYLLDFRYANGSCNLTDDNKSANRTLWVNGLRAGNIVFPQRGTGLWSQWGFSNSVRVHLQKGDNILMLSYETENENMNQNGINRAIIDYLRLINIQQ